MTQSLTYSVSHSETQPPHKRAEPPLAQPEALKQTHLWRSLRHTYMHTYCNHMLGHSGKQYIALIYCFVYLFNIVISKDVCISEPFTAACPPRTVIIIRNALFGRMRSSRCIDFDTRDLDCYADVQPHLEAVCNGNSRCTIGTHIEKMRNAYIGRCSKNLAPYLHIGYTCVPGMQH